MMQAIGASLDKILFTITDNQRDEIVKSFMLWFNHKARLKPAPDLQDRIIKMEPKLKKMAKTLEVAINEGRLVIKADAESETLLNLLRRGSSWFDPHPCVEAAVVSALAAGAR